MKTKLLLLTLMCTCLVGCGSSKEKIVYVDQSGNVINENNFNLSVSNDGNTLMYMTEDELDFLNFMSSLDIEKYEIISCGLTEYGLNYSSYTKYFVIYKIR